MEELHSHQIAAKPWAWSFVTECSLVLSIIDTYNFAKFQLK